MRIKIITCIYVYAFDHYITFCDTGKNPKLRYMYMYSIILFQQACILLKQIFIYHVFRSLKQWYHVFRSLQQWRHVFHYNMYIMYFITEDRLVSCLSQYTKWFILCLWSYNCFLCSNRCKIACILSQ